MPFFHQPVARSRDGAARITKLIQQFNTQPKLTLQGLKGLKLTYAFRNDHFGARHFAKEELPRIRWANPNLDIRIETVNKREKEEWKPEMEIEFENGTTQTLSMQSKWSSAILSELMSLAGGEEWTRHVQRCEAEGKSVLPPPPQTTPKHFRLGSVKPAGREFTPPGELPTLAQFRLKQAELEKVQKATKAAKNKATKAAEAKAEAAEIQSAPPPTATAAAEVGTSPPS